MTLFGGSPAYADMLAKRGVVPKDKYDLSALQCVMLAGSPVSPEVYAWFLRNVKRDLWLHVGSGGTDVLRRLHRRLADAAGLRGRAPAPQPRRRRLRVQRIR